MRQVVRVGEEPSIKAAVHVQVDVDEAGGDVEAGDIGLSLRSAGQLRPHSSDFAVFDSEVSRAVDVVFGVDEVAVFEQDVVVGGHSVPFGKRIMVSVAGKVPFVLQTQ